MSAISRSTVQKLISAINTEQCEAVYVETLVFVRVFVFHTLPVMSRTKATSFLSNLSTVWFVSEFSFVILNSFDLLSLKLSNRNSILALSTRKSLAIMGFRIIQGTL